MQKLLKQDPIFVRNKENAPGRSSCSMYFEYGFKYDEKTKQQVRYVTGERDLDKEIQAMAGHDVFSEIRKLSGKTIIDKMNNAVEGGLATLGGDFPTADTTGIPDNIHEAEELIDAGKEAFDQLPQDLTGGYADSTDFIKNMSKAKLDAYVNEKVAAALEAAKGDK